jgi:hypothetical protein
MALSMLSALVSARLAYTDHIRQADKGGDFDVLEGTAPTPEPEIH